MFAGYSGERVSLLLEGTGNQGTPYCDEWSLGGRCRRKANSSHSDDGLKEAQPQCDGLSGVQPSGACSREIFVLSVCSGPARSCDFASFCEQICQKLRYNVKAILIDSVIDPWLSLLNCDTLNWCDKLLPHCVGGLFQPPCSGFSAARHVKIKGGPRPLRTRANPRIPLPHLSDAERATCFVGSYLALRCFSMMCDMSDQGGTLLLEHPADRLREPYPSIFASRECDEMLLYTNSQRRYIDQCMFGAPSRKPTEIIIPDNLDPEHDTIIHDVICRHPEGHKPLLGKNASGHFNTLKSARYPPRLSHALARLLVARIPEWLCKDRSGHAASGTRTWEDCLLPIVECPATSTRQL